LTCVRFVPHSYQRDFVSIAPLSGCFSSVGRAGGRQPLSLAPACLRRGKGVALHELMHVAGFWHEHSRADRDDYVRIAWEHVLPGFEGNFMKSRTPNMLVGYDYSSVLHYSRFAFSRSGAPTITPLRSPAAALGQRRALSASDAARVNRLYGCRDTARHGAPRRRGRGAGGTHAAHWSFSLRMELSARPSCRRGWPRTRRSSWRGRCSAGSRAGDAGAPPPSPVPFPAPALTGPCRSVFSSMMAHVSECTASAGGQSPRGSPRSSRPRFGGDGVSPGEGKEPGLQQW
uniref:Metalloendopeptidase n=1 Tax=Nothoprocta perdicaria TaxID=30464 RepID=A0A8C6ZGV1_NOTPE